MGDDSPPIGLLESIVLSDAVEKSQTLMDLGIFPISRWHLQGKCSKHGSVNITYETTDGDPQNEGFLKCIPCWYDHGVDKWVPVTGAKKV